MFLKFFLEDVSPFCRVTNTPGFGLLVTSVLGFKARMDASLTFSSVRDVTADFYHGLAVDLLLSINYVISECRYERRSPRDESVHCTI